MLFDLQGKRRRVVQAVYLGLAVLMGGGFVLFGIGGDISGGLFDAFKDGNGGSGNQVIEDRIESNEERVEQNPKAEAALKELVRDHYSLAAAYPTEEDGSFSKDARGDLDEAAANWEAYLALNPKRVDQSLALLAVQLFDPLALDRPKQAVKAAQIVAREQNSASAYLQLYQYATLARNKRIQDLSSQKAIALTPKRQRMELRRQIDRLRGAIVAQQIQSGEIDIEGITPEENSKSGDGEGATVTETQKGGSGKQDQGGK